MKQPASVFWNCDSFLFIPEFMTKLFIFQNFVHSKYFKHLTFVVTLTWYLLSRLFIIAKNKKKEEVRIQKDDRCFPNATESFVLK